MNDGCKVKMYDRANVHGAESSVSEMNLSEGW